MQSSLRAPVQSRSIATRARLVKAAAKCLVERGYAGASTAAVAAEAGVSQGALFKHFASKGELFGACLEHILADLRADFRADVQRRLPPGPVSPVERLEPAVTALWHIFRRPVMHAVFEVYVAARTDAPLGARLEPILVAHREGIVAEAAALFPELVTPGRPVDPVLVAAVDAVVYAMQGVALGLFAPAAADEHLPFFLRLARHELTLALGASSNLGRT